tara:strand:+ start:112 stop:699 length:588 start_codon:yes stop_codon:yes gene_type:complete
MATTLTLREVKGSPLTFGEMDSNLTSIDGNKQEIIPNLTLDTVIQANLDKFSFYDSATSTTRAILAENVTPFVERTLIVKCVNDNVGPPVGDGLTHITIPSTLDGKKIINTEAHVYTVGTGGSITNVQLHNLTTGYDILSTPITIDLNEKDSSTAATPHVISAYNEVSTGNVIRVDVDASATNTRGLEIRIVLGT